MSGRSSGEVPRVAKEVLEYFLRNPQAADTLEGVARWRLMEEQVHRSVAEVNQALGWLVSEGFLMEESANGEDPMFRLNREKDGEVQRFVADAGDPKTRRKRPH